MAKGTTRRVTKPLINADSMELMVACVKMPTLIFLLELFQAYRTIPAVFFILM
ncbi:hypothetical protein CCACVL1_10899, partial [Corchorus capsularis]